MIESPPPYRGYTIDRALEPEGYYSLRLYMGEMKELLSERQYQEVILWAWGFCEGLTKKGEPTVIMLMEGHPVVVPGLT